MGTVYVEARPKGNPAGARIDDYAVEDHADHALATFKTQREALEWAKKTATDRILPAFAISTIRRKLITGGRFRTRPDIVIIISTT
jgi:hypothetical protein